MQSTTGSPPSIAAIQELLVQCIIDLVIVYLLSLVGVDKTLEIGAA